MESSLSIIIPCFNEEAAITPVLNNLIEIIPTLKKEGSLQKIEVIVVDDASTDRSLALLQKLLPRVGSNSRLIQLEKNLGYGNAIKEGMKTAKGDLIAFFDMDATYEPLDLVRMIDSIQNSSADVVWGNRLSDLSKMPFTRYIGNRFFIFVTHILFGVRVEDCCSGIRVFKKTLSPLFISELPGSLNFTLAMTVLVLWKKIPFLELPTRYYRRVGTSKLNLVLDGLLFLKTLISFRYFPKIVPEAANDDSQEPDSLYKETQTLP